MGTDGAGLFCLGSSVVAENHQDDPESSPLIRSPKEDLPQDTQHEESAANEEDS